ncbi:MAG: DUF2892 domain-containing protein [Chitinophagaceae bacterium]|nr:MAG: DUF2892 domain-containing protein [Chitinophagaceae bacterium]
MKTNIGLVDRGLRIFLSILLVDLYLKHTISGMIGIVLLAIPVFFFITSFIGYCPVYYFFRISTKKKDIQSHHQ